MKYIITDGRSYLVAFDSESGNPILSARKEDARQYTNLDVARTAVTRVNRKFRVEELA